jgi:hypothetical protein
MKTWLCKFWTVGRVLQHCPYKFCKCLSNVYICILLGFALEEPQCWYFSCRMYSMDKGKHSDFLVL